MKPKYKFGDIVKPHGCPKFTIERIIETNTGKFYYSEIGRGDWPEDELQLLEDPSERRLYAYRARGTNTIVYSMIVNLDELEEVYVKCSGCDEDFVLAKVVSL